VKLETRGCTKFNPAGAVKVESLPFELQLYCDISVLVHASKLLYHAFKTLPAGSMDAFKVLSTFVSAVRPETFIAAAPDSGAMSTTVQVLLQVALLLSSRLWIWLAGLLQLYSAKDTVCMPQ
jgi:hypothetical protein